MVSHDSRMLARPILGRFATALFLTIYLIVAAVGPAAAADVPRKYAGIVVDAKAGKVLYENAADAARYPASVTKVMTLYVLFQELAAGNIKLSDKMTVSKHAASAVPTKLGLKAGSSIKVEDAIKSLVTLSANDISRVIAEHISGSESKFAERMTATAKALGMHRTTYRNASGLPDSKQITTVRDQSILAIAIYQHFPKYYEYFQTRSFSYGKRTYGNHNRLLGERGVDGVKTGYTRASGFNLMTAARPENRHVVVIAFGFDTSKARDAKVRELVKKYASKGRNGGYLSVAMIPAPGRRGATVQVASAQAVPVTPMPYPQFRISGQQVGLQVATIRPDPAAVAKQLADPVIVSSVGTQPAPAARPVELGIRPAVQAANQMGGATSLTEDRPLDVIGAWLSETFSLGAAPAPLGQTSPSAPLLPPVGIGDQGQPVDPMTSGTIAAPAEPVLDQQPPPVLAASADIGIPAARGWVVQIGATPTQNGAVGLLNDAAGTIADLGSFQPYVERFEKNGQVFYRARFVGFGDRDAAAEMCNQLKKAKMSCLAMQS